MVFKQEFRRGIRRLCSKATKKSTRDNYDRNLRHYWDYCDKYNKDYLDVSSKQVLHFIYYLFQYTTKRHKGADQCVTALGNYWKLNGFDWDRKRYPTIRMMLTGYQDEKPSEKRERRPFSFFHMKEAFKHIAVLSYTGALISAALCIGYYFGARAGEYSANAQKDWPYIIRRKDVTVILGNNPRCFKSLMIDFRRHKTNRWGLYNAQVSANCACDSGICPTKLIMRFIHMREKRWGKAMDLPLLITKKGLPIKPQHINCAIQNLVKKMGLNPEIYASHSLRSGRATDLARAQKSALAIKKWGRWRSDCWEDFYAKLDFSDIAMLSQTTPEDLGLLDNELSKRADAKSRRR